MRDEVEERECCMREESRRWSAIWERSQRRGSTTWESSEREADRPLLCLKLLLLKRPAVATILWHINLALTSPIFLLALTCPMFHWLLISCVILFKYVLSFHIVLYDMMIHVLSFHICLTRIIMFRILFCKPRVLIIQYYNDDIDFFL